MEESYDDNNNKMPTTYDQTCIIQGKDAKTYVISPRPVAPAFLGPDEDGVIRGHIFEDLETKPCYWERNILASYEWHPSGDVIRTDPNGTTTIWFRKPSIKDFIFSNFKSYYLQTKSDGSCVLRGIDEDKQEFTMYWFEEREVDEPLDHYWMSEEDYVLGRHSENLLPEGWYCRKCHNSRCLHVKESRMKNYKYNNESPATTSGICESEC